MSAERVLEEAREQVRKIVPSEINITSIDFEGPLVVIYTRDLETFASNNDIIRQLVDGELEDIVRAYLVAFDHGLDRDDHVPAEELEFGCVEGGDFVERDAAHRHAAFFGSLLSEGGCAPELGQQARERAGSGQLEHVPPG